MVKFFDYSVNTFDPFAVAKGQLDLAPNFNSYFGMVDESQTTPLLAGDPVALVNTGAGLPRFKKAAVGDIIAGFVKWDTKRNSWDAGMITAISFQNDIMWMESGAAIASGSAVNITDLANVTVGAAAGAGSVIGNAIDGASAANQPIRVRIAAPVVYAANS